MSGKKNNHFQGRGDGMSDKKYVVPEGMLEAAMRASLEAGLALGPSTEVGIPLEAALRWLSENPIVPTQEQIHDLTFGMHGMDPFASIAVKRGAIDWQRRMFLAPEPEVPEDIKDLLSFADKEYFAGVAREKEIPVGVYKAAVIKAFRRGQKARQS